MTFRQAAWWGLAVIALHNGEEALTIPTWLPPRLAQLEAQFGVRPLAADVDQLYFSLGAATLVPALWVAAAAQSAPRSIGVYSIIVLYGVFFANALVPHLLGTTLLGTYVPGVITAGALVIPFTIWLCYRARVEDDVSTRGLVIALLVAVAIYVPALSALLGLDGR
jgi:hypothetical protein